MSCVKSNYDLLDGVTTLVSLCFKPLEWTVIGVKNITLITTSVLCNLAKDVSRAVINKMEEMERARIAAEENQIRFLNCCRLIEANLAKVERTSFIDSVTNREQFIEDSIRSVSALLDGMSLNERKAVFTPRILKDIDALRRADLYSLNSGEVEALYRLAVRVNEEIVQQNEEGKAVICALKGVEYIQDMELEITGEEIINLSNKFLHDFMSFEKTLSCKWVDNASTEAIKIQQGTFRTHTIKEKLKNKE